MLVRRTQAWAIAGTAVAFIGLTLSIRARWATGLDLAFTQALHRIANSPLDSIAGTISIAFSFEAVTAFAAIAALLLWRGGSGLWALAPFSFIALTAIELALKASMPTDPIPDAFHRAVFYPLTEVSFPGSFPSGHALRIGFIGLAAASLVRAHAPSARWLWRLGIAVMTIICGLSRVYLGEHWLSDVIGGLLLGGALGGVVAQWVSYALARQQSNAPEPVPPALNATPH